VPERPEWPPRRRCLTDSRRQALPKGWVETTLSEVADVTIGRQRSPKNATGEHMIRYLRSANVKDGSLDLRDVLEMNFNPREQGVFALLPGDVLVSEGSASQTQVGASAVWQGELPGRVCFQNTLLRFRAKPDVSDPGFLAAWTSHTHRSGKFAEIAGGSSILHIGSERASTMPVQWPTLVEQRRIADLIHAFDGQAAALDSEAKTVEEVLHRMLDQAWDDPDEAIPVGSVADLASGPSWAASDERPAPEPGTTPVVKITNTRPDGRLDLSERLYVKSLASTRLLDDRSLIAIRTNGNRERIGNVYLPNDEVFGSAVSAFQFIVQCQSSANRDYLYWVMRAPRTQRIMSDAASGSTGLGNMGARWLRALEVPWPGAEARTRFVEQASVTASVLDGLLNECQCLRVVRSTLLTSLLSGQVTIPDSYQSLLAEAV
jgi:type I restriction enzyme, S subunit